MEIYRIENLSFTYPNRETQTLYDINLTVKKGEFLTVCGRSGCGKTTLLRLLKTSLAPFGDKRGNIKFCGNPICDLSHREQASKIGFVMQNPDSQIVTDKVWHELAFGLESLGYKTEEIRARVAEMASFFGIQTWFHKKVTELSGGQKQLLNLASVMVMQPSVLILDEPTSRLDPISAQEFIKILEKINRELGTTVIIAEHRLDEVLGISDRVVVMNSGTIIADDTPQKTAEILKSLNHPMFRAFPVSAHIYGSLEGGSNYPLSIKEGREWFFKYAQKNSLNPSLIPAYEPFDTTDTAVSVKDVWFRYDKKQPDIIKGLNLSVSKGEIFAVMGGNGTGKTTALSLISGINQPQRGKIKVNGNISALPQEPQALFVKNTVFLDLKEIEDSEEIIKSIVNLCEIKNLLEYHPYDLSGGEQQRVALAKVLLTSPDILLLDEPTKGMDSYFKKIFSDILKALKKRGITVIMVSHDIEFCAENADRCAMFFDGGITSVGTPREFFKEKSFYTTGANKIARTILPDAVLKNDIIIACGGKTEENYEDFIELPPKKTNLKTKTKKESHKTKLSKRTLLSMLLILLAIPLTIYFGMYHFGDRKYYLTSILIIFETMLPFMMVFESRKPQARELVIISVICAIAVAGRAVFYTLPQFKPVLAVVIIAGVCFGGETGFLVGAVSGFVSNFFAGQGPWTPWQMFALGITGFIAGILFKKGFIGKTKVALSIFGGITAFLIYGVIMNFASVIMVQNTPTLKLLASAYIAGATFDLIHAFATAFFLWFISEPMIEKIERIKVKYGLLP